MSDAAVTIGDQLPDLSLPCLDGDTLRLSEPRGKSILLFFWGSW